VIAASITPRQLTRDPEPWAHLASGRRRATLPPAELGNYTRAREWAYVPRDRYVPVTYHPANPILAACRMDDWHDTWGTALSWAFACAAALGHLGEDVPDYRPSAAGASADLTDGWPNAEVATLLGLGHYDTAGQEVTLTPLFDLTDETWDAAVAFARHAFAVLTRLAELTPESDRY
jgi:hypothetical protein